MFFFSGKKYVLCFMFYVDNTINITLIAIKYTCFVTLQVQMTFSILSHVLYYCITLHFKGLINVFIFNHLNMCYDLFLKSVFTRQCQIQIRHTFLDFKIRFTVLTKQFILVSIYCHICDSHNSYNF